MSLTWRGEEPPRPPRPGAAGLARAVLRGVPLVLLLLGGLAVVALARPLERGRRHPHRAVGARVTMGVCRAALRLLSLRTDVAGRLMEGAGVVAANHSSWLDVLVLNALGPVTFVAKSEVAGWPGIGALARATGTLFVRRESRGEAAAQAAALAERLRRGERLALFPEGTSTDNRRVLPFRPALFQGLLGPGMPPGLSVQPATLAYEAPPGEDPRFHAWFGSADLGPHLLAVLAARRGGRVRVTLHEPIPVAGRARKALAAMAEERVRSAL